MGRGRKVAGAPIRIASREWVAIGLVTLVGIFLRFWALGDVPPGLYHDEAINGMDALKVLEGERPVFFAANNGREPLFIYTMALTLALWGRSPQGVRAAAAFLGSLAVPATYLMSRRWFSQRTAWLAAWLMAVSVWPVNLSRIGLRAISMPLVVALALWWTGEAIQRRRVGWALVAGVGWGLTFYTYTAARFIPVIWAGFALYQWWRRRKRHLSGVPEARMWWGMVLAAGGTLLPLVGYALAHPDLFALRVGQVAVWNPAIGGERPWLTAAGNVVRAVGLFTFRGDFIPRHNIPLRPLFDPLAGICFWIGVWVCGRRAVRGDAVCAFALLWMGGMLLPTILAEDCPHFLRAVGVLPVAMLFPALGVEAVGRWSAERRAWLNVALTVAVALVSLGATVYGYFYRYGRDPELGYAFEAGEVRLATEVNQFLGIGWNGVGWRAKEGEPAAGREVVIDARLWDARPTVRFLVPESSALHVRHSDAEMLPFEQGTELLVFAWPFEDRKWVRDLAPVPAWIEVTEGAWERGDLDPEARLLYARYAIRPVSEEGEPVARFEGGIALQGWEVEPRDGALLVRLLWRAEDPVEADYTAFVHVVRDGVVVVQSDAAPAKEYWPTSWWRVGDVVVDERLISLEEEGDYRLRVGWYLWPSMEHLRVLEAKGDYEPEAVWLEP